MLKKLRAPNLDDLPSRPHVAPPEDKQLRQAALRARFQPCICSFVFSTTVENKSSLQAGHFSPYHLPALTKAPVVALITPMPFRSVSLVP
jgi:hypothetical protein